MISFYPGPSRVHDEIPEYVKDACDLGVVSINHRSAEFMAISSSAADLLKTKLKVPQDYTIFYTSSATECWEIIAQSVITSGSMHLYNGAFGNKWFEYTRRLCASAVALPFHREELPDVTSLRIRDENTVICLTQNETSNGTQVKNDTIRSIKDRYPENIIAVDATSGMAGVNLDFGAADIWFASVQKCFGLPAGLGIMICSPLAMKSVWRKNEADHYNSLTFMAQMMEKWQTPFTPNVLNIYLLMRVLQNCEVIGQTHERMERRYHEWMAFLSQKESLSHLVQNKLVHSLTVIPITGEAGLVAEIKSEARKNGFLLGEGYGDLKSSTFRIANFPALKESEVELLRGFLSRYH